MVIEREFGNVLLVFPDQLKGYIRKSVRIVFRVVVRYSGGFIF